MDMPRGNRAQSIASNGSQMEDKKLLQCSQLRQLGEFQHVSVSERQQSCLCGQNLCGPFVSCTVKPALAATWIRRSAWESPEIWAPSLHTLLFFYSGHLRNA